MTGQQELDLLKQILGGEGINQAYALQLINLAKMKYEQARPWKALVAVDNSQTVNGGNTYLTPLNLPSNFIRYLGESSLAQGSIVLFDGNDNVQFLTEVPFEQRIFYRTEFGRMTVDYANEKLYIMGIVPGSFTVYQYYIQFTPDITLNTSWEKIPARFHAILAFDAAARWRLGTDYDDVNARNADDNAKMAASIFDAMSSWDTELAISAINSIDYRNDRYPQFMNNRSNNNFLP